MADKALKISVKSDLREGRKLAEFITDLQKRVDKFAKTLGNINIGGAGPGGQAKPGQQGLLKQLTEDKRAMEAMGRETESLQRRYRHLGDEFNILTARLQLAEKHMQRFQAAAGGKGGPGGAAPGGMPSWFQTPGGPMPPWFQNPAGGAPPGGGPPGAPPATPGGGGINWTQPVGGALGQVARFVGWGAIVRNMMEGVLGAPQRQIDWATMQGNAQASNGASVGNLASRMLGGDVMPAVGLMRAMGKGHGFTAMNKDRFREVVEAGPDAALNAAVRAGITSTATLNIVKGWNDAARSGMPQSVAAKQNQLFASLVRTGEEQDPTQNAFMQYAQGQAPGRVGFSRRYGKGFAAGIPLGNSVDANQTMATVGAVLDALGTGVNVNKVTRIVTEATRLGLTSESIQTMLRAQEMGGGNLVEKVLRSGLSRPMMGRAGTAAAGMADQSLMRINPDLFLGGFTSGGNVDEKTMRAREAGAGFLNQVTTGGLDAYQATVNMSLATKKGRSVFTTGVLGKMTLQELMQAASKNGPTAEQRLAGVTGQMARDLLNDEVNSLAGRAFSEKGVKQPQAIQMLLEAARGEGGIMGAAERFQKMGGRAGREGLRSLETGLNMVTGQALGSQPLSFLTGAQSGGPQGEKAGETGGMYRSALTASMAGAKEMERDWVKMTLAMKDLQGVTSGYQQTVEVLGDAMKALTAEDATKSQNILMGLGNAMGDIAKNGPDAVKVMDKVVEFVDALAERKSAIENASRDQLTWGAEGYVGGSQAP